MLSMVAGEIRTTLFMYLALRIALDLKLSVECVHPCAMIKESVFVRERCLVLFRLPLTWEESKNYCDSNFYGGSISELLSEEERIKASGLLKTHGSSSAWLGLTDNETSGHYLWTYSRTTINETFLLNNVTLLSHEGHCIQLLTNNTFTVNDCQNQGNFFCDIDFKGLENVADSCYPWKSSVFKDGICYKSFNIPLSPSEAKIQCQTFNASISETTGTVEYGVISQYIKERNYTSGVWVGAYVDYDGFYKWNTSSTKLLYQWVDNFTQVNVSSRTQLSCVAMNPIEGLFYEVSCAIANYYLCERADPCWFLKESVYIRGRCLVLSNTMLTWTQAKSYCENNFYGGRLSELIFENERKTSSELIHYFRVKSSQAWIALTSRKNGTFQWTYSNTSISKFNGFQWQESGHDYLVGNESCVAIVDVDTFNVTGCEELSNVLCDIEVNRLEPITDPCYPWKNSVFDNGTCFILFTSLMTWDKAHTLCAEKGYKLVELTTDSRLTSAANFLKVQGQSAWVGAQRKNDPYSHEFAWTSSNVSITVNWTDVVDTNTSDVCVLLDPVSGLYGESCSSQHALVCEVAKRDPCKSIKSNYVSINGQCYLRRNDHLSWTEAQEACLKDRSTLAYPSNTTDFTNKLLTMVKLNETVWLQDSNNKAVKWFNASIVPATSTDSETHAFICQTAAAALRLKDYIIAVPTALTASSSFKNRLSITSSYSTITVYLNITSVCGAQMLYKYYSVDPFSSLTLHLEPLVISCNKYVSRRYAQVTSTQPVTIVLQVEDSASRLAGSTLVLPAAMFTPSGVARSYFVENILKKLIGSDVK
ncbi:secretory phospholipase A2 receptor-like [Biomphalaria glabrata]|uniref:Secretory phospholipase A2 receptor-like n=1 Tax=Biomphalaria glabrata TaxID=6526 RepID=A0A9W2YWJ9_BIOGL|nr:secretory phospholipase A2 receptor-like [Biomphalaria glabrata]